MHPQPVSPDSLCFLNGEFLPLAEARVPVLDRGFLFGDGVYELLPVYGRRLFRFADHMARLERNLGRLRIPNPFDRDQWLAHARRLIAAQPAEDQSLYLQLTRGVAPRDHVMPEGLTPTVFMMSSPTRAPTPEQRHQGVACITARDFRWERGDLKTTSLLGNVLARQISADHGASETILLREAASGISYLTEGSASNVWVVHEGALLGPPKSEHVLEGIRYELLRELCEEVGIAYNLRPIPEADLRSADEILLSSAAREVLPVTRLDGEPVGHGALRGKPGPVYGRLYEAYQRAKILQSV
ncbi:D-amino acid aminotransferase [Azohydromonas caseinilytica]|uniref:D-amino acid aminotransferase n=1 Tax=Azohydromonas caseinilytica TaxID=2728836 RepID=A0A848FFG1_9BURK|nr:D-amino acid aminotransferase [Azohydromonas caseinilytica]NML18967.1 D-amino acid aminotransferase [Azohydromonas caseinilytica]